MNILFILPEYYPHSGGGISTYYLHYLKALKPSCKKIKVIVGSGYVQRDEYFTIDEIEVEYLSPSLYSAYLNKFSKFDLFPDLKKNLAAAWAMYEQANYGEGFDVIECTDFAMGFVPWVVDHKRPVLTRFHGSTGQITFYEQDPSNILQNDFVRQSELLLLPLCNILISHSFENKTAWEALLSKKVTHILPVFCADKTDPVPFADRNHISVVTSRIQVWKGPIELCKAVLSINNEIIPIEWYGRDTSYRNGENMSSYLKSQFPSVWGQSIVPQKPLNYSAINSIQKRAKYGLISSTWDMFNFSCTEYLAAGTPIICSDGAGASELIEHGVNGFKYKADDPDDLAKCLKIIYHLDELTYNRISAAGIATVNKRLSAEQVIPQNLKLYNHVLHNFDITAANDFIKHIYSPSDKQTDLNDTLDGQPLKKIMKYLLKRINLKYKYKR